MGDESCLLFYSAMRDYTVSKQYNSDFVDLIPQICANSLNCDVNIIMKHSGEFIFCKCVPIDSQVSMKAFVYKNGDHYDSLIQSIKPQTSDGTQCLDGGIRSALRVSDPSTQNNNKVYFNNEDDEFLQSDCNNNECVISDFISSDLGGTIGNSPACIASSSTHSVTSTLDKCELEYVRPSSGPLLSSGTTWLRSFGICFHNIHGLSIEKLSDDSLGPFFQTILISSTCRDMAV